MKKTIFTLAALCMAVAANATILRVSNVTGSSAPYSDLQVAVDAASAGDTIMVDGSVTDYGTITISKTIVLIGPGYWRVENGLIEEGASSAVVSKVTIEETAEGTVLKGLETNGEISVNAPNVIITKCLVRSGIKLRPNSTRCVIHQNRIAPYNVEPIYAIEDAPVSYVQITNNIMQIGNASHIYRINESYVAYNTIFNGRGFMNNCNNCTFEKNILDGCGDEGLKSNCTLVDNYSQYGRIYQKYSPGSSWNNKLEGSDLVIKNEVIENDETREGIAGKGAFAGDSPYVISGIPDAPVIHDLVMPTTVEKGKKMNVTIKVGIQK